MFSGFSNIIQNDLNEAIGDVIRYDMNIKEASAAPFVSAEVDESTDVTNKAQSSAIMWLKAQSWLKILNGKKYIQYSEDFQGKLYFSGQAQVTKKSWTIKIFSIQCIQYSIWGDLCNLG